MSLATIDLDFTRENLDHDPELVLELIQIAIEDLPSLANQLRDALSSTETVRFRWLAHAIKGLASNFRAEPLTRLASQLEMTNAEQQKFALQQLVDELSVACESTVLALRSELQLDPKPKESFDENAAQK